MKITVKSLESAAERQGVPVLELKYLDLSNHGIATIENIQEGVSVQTLLLRGNNISIIENLALCHQLWHVDISSNDVTNLYTLSRFIALGSLNLSFNNLHWNELMKIRHMHILELFLHGNIRLEKDPNYRIHVIDSIPCVWMLDGRLITAAERIQVEEFFQQSALSSHPVRKKLTREQFIPSSLKKLQVEGTYGERTVHLMMRFPTKGALNIATDKRRLQYLAYNLQEDLKVDYQFRQSKFSPLPMPDFESVLESRLEHFDQCNILLLLLVAFLDFSLPFDLLQETVTCAQLDSLCERDVRLLFALPKAYICRLSAILLSAIKIDRDDNKEIGLYEKLYLSLHCIVEELVRAGNKGKVSINHKPSYKYKDLRAILGCEAIQLFCIVPGFFQYLTSNQAVMDLVTYSTNDGAAVDKLVDLINRIHFQGGDDHRVVEEVADFLVTIVQKSTRRLLGKQMIPSKNSSYSLMMKKVHPRRPQSSSIYSSSFLAVGRPSPKLHLSVRKPGVVTPTVRHIKPPWQPDRLPKLGDKVLLGRQNLSFILALPEHDVALIQMENIPAPTGSVVNFSKNNNEHYAYLDLSQFSWDWKYSYWKPFGTKGDRLTLHDDDELAAFGNTPRTVDEEPSPRNSLEEEDDTTLHPSSRDSMEDLAEPISVLVKEKLKLKPSGSLLEQETSEKSLKDEAKEEDRSETKETRESSGHEAEMGLLYDCIKCAMDSVKENNKNVPPPTPTETKASSPTMDASPARVSDVDSTSPGPSPELLPADLADRVTKQDLPSVKGGQQNIIKVDLSPEGLSDQRGKRVSSKQRPKSSYQRPKSSISRSSAIQSRPSTASSVQNHRETVGNPIMIQMGNFWLAGGKDLNFQERLDNYQKTQHTPGWMDGAIKRPKSVGPRQQRRQILHRRAQSAGTQRESLWVGVSSSTSNQHPPSLASSEVSISPEPCSSPKPEPNYMHQSRQQNYLDYFSLERAHTPPYGAPKRPSSPLEMTIK
ncbi:Protein tilB-like [Holothuria leucospilota]|uniref:Protein tilB-like n=1 Tax=Holothuria leucospilota TaxID=206669 RepID=A0A9Q1HBZ4_HOLLE|nr:Protein tilB-like [Holothuria leucospilota]